MLNPRKSFIDVAFEDACHDFFMSIFKVTAKEAWFIYDSYKLDLKPVWDQNFPIDDPRYSYYVWSESLILARNAILREIQKIYESLKTVELPDRISAQNIKEGIL